MSMQLKRLAGYGPIAAYVSAASLLMFYLVQQSGVGAAIVKAAPGMFAPLVIASFVAFALWVASFVVVLFDLERDRPATSMRWMQVARGAALVALAVQIPLDIGLILNAGVPVQAPSYFLIYGGVGISLLTHNLAARRAGLSRGVLPWLGAVTGVAYLVAGIGFGSFPIPGVGMTLYLIGFNVLQLGQLLYIAWAIWTGVKLSRSQAAAPVAMAATTR